MSEFENAIKDMTKRERHVFLLSALYHRETPDIPLDECVAYAERVVAALDEREDCK